MSVIIETICISGTEWGVSFTSHNPEPHDYVECASYKDAERLLVYLVGLDEQTAIRESELSASQARESELREKLDGLTGEASVLASKLEAAEAQRIEMHQLLSAETTAKFEYKQRAEEAEARIKASQEQEPAIHVGYSHAYAETIVRNTEEKMASAWCSRYDSYYSQPQIPPELAELQRELTKSVREACSLAVENAELRKLLESKVPSKLVVMQKPIGHIPESEQALHDQEVYVKGWNACVDAMLAAAPQPKEPKQSPETDLDEALRRQ